MLNAPTAALLITGFAMLLPGCEPYEEPPYGYSAAFYAPAYAAPPPNTYGTPPEPYREAAPAEETEKGSLVERSDTPAADTQSAPAAEQTSPSEAEAEPTSPAEPEVKTTSTDSSTCGWWRLGCGILWH